MARSPKNIFLVFFFMGISFCLMTCKNDKGIPDYNGYSSDVGKIIITKCATKGCHNDISKGAAGGLSLESWSKLFAGGSGSSCVIPYRPDYSTFLYYINTYDDLGVTLKPTMPYKKAALTRNEVVLIRNWIAEGAPNIDGLVKFSDNSNRKKIYVTNQGCDVVTVFDKETLLPMRYISVGSSSSIESPHMIKISPDGEYWYIIFLAGNYFEKYRTADDQLVSKAFIGSGYWNTFAISSDSQTAYCIDLSPTNAKVVTVNLNTMAVNIQSGFIYPHGSELNKTNDILYLTQQVNSSKLYKIPVNDFSDYSEINLYNSLPAKALNAHEIKFTPDGTKYFVTCQGSSEVRAFQTSTDALLAIIPVGAMPSEMSFSSSTDHLFVTCTEDTTSFPQKRGTVAIINYKSNVLEKIVYAGHQPHGIAVDDEKKLVYVGNRNASTDGPAPHHSTQCGGRNGYVTFIDLTTLQMINSTNSNSTKRVEVSVDPYSIAIRY
jgi:DNA-binding beta-propeller fold protein YncE